MTVNGIPWSSKPEVFEVLTYGVNLTALSVVSFRKHLKIPLLTLTQIVVNHNTLSWII